MRKGILAMSLLAVGGIVSLGALQRGQDATSPPVDGQEVPTVLPAAHVEDQNTQVVLHTSGGSIIIELQQGLAPETASAFAENCRMGVYDGVAFEPGRVFCHAGAHLPDGQLKTIKSVAEPRERENLNGLMNVRGAVGLRVYSGPTGPVDSHQFYIAVRDFAPLDGICTVFGTVISGLEIVDALSSDVSTSVTIHSVDFTRGN